MRAKGDNDTARGWARSRPPASGFASLPRGLAADGASTMTRARVSRHSPKAEQVVQPHLHEPLPSYTLVPPA